MTLKNIVLSGMFGALAVTACAAAEVGSPSEVAPKAEGTRKQVWASAAWNEAAKTWLVAWREGYLNEPDKGTDIWCARVAADGKALDPAGIRLTKGKGLKDHPRVASDGKGGFLVVWEDLSNGKDWDIRGARVSVEGKVLDPDGLLVAGGDHNQARPDVAFAGGQYHVVWQAFHSAGNGDPGYPGKDTGYAISGARVSSEGKVSETKPVDVAPGMGANQQLTEPSMAGRGDDALVFCIDSACKTFGAHGWSWRMVDGKTGEAKGPGYGNARDVNNSTIKMDAWWSLPSSAALAMGTDGALAVVRDASQLYRWRHAHSLCRLNAAGALQGEPVAIGEGGGILYSHSSVTFDGDRYLVVMDWEGPSTYRRDLGLPGPFATEIHGWFVGADGKVADDPKKGFTIAAEAGKSALVPTVAAGPKGMSLVVYSECRGADDMKLLTRLVK